jgi:hypothetical protein
MSKAEFGLQDMGAVSYPATGVRKYVDDSEGFERHKRYVR